MESTQASASIKQEQLAAARLETAIGFHFCVDFVRLVAAYLFLQGLWFK